MEKELKVVKSGLNLLVFLGVTTLVGGAIALITPTKLGFVKKAAVGVTGLVITSMVSDTITDYIDKRFSDAIGKIKKYINKEEPVGDRTVIVTGNGDTIEVPLN